MYAISNHNNVDAEHRRRMSIRAGAAVRNHRRSAPADWDGRR
jgi:hypothetical protein